MIQRWCWLPVAAVTAAWGGTGCNRSCDDDLTCPRWEDTVGASGTGGEGVDPPDPCSVDPAERMPAPECGVWVASSWGDDASPGTQDQPVHTLEKALSLVKGGVGRVYACEGVFPEPVTLPGGISLAGGFTCLQGKWEYAGKDHPAVIAPTSPGVFGLKLVAGEGASLVTDLEVKVPDAVDPGGSSIAVLAAADAAATLRRCHVAAGNGMDGAPGEHGSHNGAPAQAGLWGEDGMDACSALQGAGGTGKELACDGLITMGGKGGDGGPGFALAGFAGAPAPDPNPLNSGAGGQPEDALSGTLCTGAVQGEQGYSGDSGAGAAGQGKLTDNGYVGAAGQDGLAGLPGQGGGGGGGSIGNSACAQGLGPAGAGGGGGGTGGCGGRAGKGGQAGGSSIALAVLGSGIHLDTLRLTVGNGGNGGNGGVGQLGGQGGFPGLGGMGFGDASGAKAACHGAPGGQGGNGGHGGGGHGGHSVAIASPLGADWSQAGEFDYAFGAPGFGGKGGNYKLAGTDGANGLGYGNLTTE